MDRTKTLEIFSKGFKKFMDRKGFTRNEIAKLIDCTTGNISKMKAGTGLPSVESLFSLVENGMRIEEIFGSELAEKLIEGLVPEPSNAEKLSKAEIREGVLEIFEELLAKGKKPVEILK